MLDIFNEQKKLQYQLEIEGIVARIQSKLNIIPKNAADEIFKVVKSNKITIDQIKRLEKINEHDTASLVEALSKKCKSTTAAWIHYGLTSNDLIDTSNSMQIRDAIKIIQPKITKLALFLVKKAIMYKKVPAVGRTHGQHASIITFGLKFANWALEMIKHIERLENSKKRILLCKTLGVVGTGSLMGNKAIKVQSMVAKELDLHAIDVATQVIPRERYAEYIFQLVIIGSTLDKISIEIRNLQRTEIDEVTENFKKNQMGSSAVPTKKNPIKSERISSLAKMLRGTMITAFENIPLWHERDLSNSANERFTIPLCSILLDEMLETMIKIIENMTINIKKINSNIELTKGQIFSEFIMQALIKKGMPRLIAYRHIQRIAFACRKSGASYKTELNNDKNISSKLTSKEIDEIFVAKKHLGSSIIIINNINKLVKRSCKKS